MEMVIKKLVTKKLIISLALLSLQSVYGMDHTSFGEHFRARRQSQENQDFQNRLRAAKPERYSSSDLYGPSREQNEQERYEQFKVMQAVQEAEALQESNEVARLLDKNKKVYEYCMDQLSALSIVIADAVISSNDQFGLEQFSRVIQAKIQEIQNAYDRNLLGNQDKREIDLFVNNIMAEFGLE